MAASNDPLDDFEIGAIEEIAPLDGSPSPLACSPSTPALLPDVAGALAPRTYRELADLRMLQLLKLHPSLDDPRLRFAPDVPPTVRCSELLAKITGENVDFCVHLLQGTFSVGGNQVAKWAEEFRNEPWAQDFNWRLFGPLEVPAVAKNAAPQPELLPVFVIIEEGSGRVEIRLPPGYVALKEQCSARIAGEANDTAFIQLKIRKE